MKGNLLKGFFLFVSYLNADTPAGCQFIVMQEVTHIWSKHNCNLVHEGAFMSAFLILPQVNNTGFS